MDKQYSVQFFSAFVEAVQRLCRDYLDFDQAVEIGGYLSVEIDNYRKERYVISEMLQQSGNVISESYCTKAFKTHSRCCVEKSALRERHQNVSEFCAKYTTSDSQLSGLQSSDAQKSVLETKQSRSFVLRTNIGEEELPEDIAQRSSDDYNNESYCDDYRTGKRRASLLSTVQRLRNTSAVSNDCIGEKSSEEVRSKKRASSFYVSSPSKRGTALLLHQVSILIIIKICFY